MSIKDGFKMFGVITIIVLIVAEISDSITGIIKKEINKKDKK